MINKKFYALSVLVALLAGFAGGKLTQTAILPDGATVASTFTTDHLTPVELIHEQKKGTADPERVVAGVINDAAQLHHIEDGIVHIETDREQRREALQDLVENFRSRNVLLDEFGEQIVFNETDQAIFFNQLGEHLRENPAAVTAALDAYSTLASPTVKALFRSLLGELQSSEVEQFAIKLTVSGDAQALMEGVELFSYMSVGNAKTRDALFRVVDATTTPNTAAAAIRAVRPEILPLNARQKVEQRFTEYAASEHPGVRAAVIEQLSAWSDGDAAEAAISNGLFDDSNEVRSAAIFAAGTSRVRSSSIRQRLFDTVTDTNESWNLREQSFRAIQAYPLQDSEYQAVYQFHQQMQQINNQHLSQG